MQAVLGGEMQGLLSVSDLCLLVMHYQWYALPHPTGGEVGEGGDLSINSQFPIYGARCWCSLPITVNGPAAQLT